MGCKAPRPSGQRFPHNCVPSNLGGGVPFGRHVNNVSLQTGEESSVDFLRDRLALVAPRGSPVRSDIERVRTKRVGFNFHQSIHLGYEDLTSIRGLRRTESDSISDVDSHAECQWILIRCPMTFQMRLSSLLPLCTLQESRNHPHSSGTPTFSKSGRFKFLCSFDGKILPRRGDERFGYVGGEACIISISKNLFWQELTQKTLRSCNQSHTIMLPGEDLDALISVSSDEDLHNMVEEYNGLDKADGFQRLCLFLIPSN